MRAFLQRVSESQVKVDNTVIGSIQNGLLILVGIEATDGIEDIQWLSNKICHMRIFNDAQGLMNVSVKDIDGDILVVSQFTLHAETKKGNRPSFINAAKPDIAIPIYEQFKTQLAQDLGKPIQCGQFGADMKVQLINDGPVSIWIDTKNKQ
ncbi:MAG: D-aminoacyl-tRNA deacylase [Bacteroidia bacterium]|nr:D-aminoacyl-tRNA deacylase [Bacteroidia bacterium]